MGILVRDVPSVDNWCIVVPLVQGSLWIYVQFLGIKNICLLEDIVVYLPVTTNHSLDVG